MLIFLECWVFLPQQICFAEGSWLWLASGQEEHALCCGCQNARITAQVGGGEWGLLPELTGPPWKEAGPHPALGLCSPAFCFPLLGTVATFLS